MGTVHYEGDQSGREVSFQRYKGGIAGVAGTLQVTDGFLEKYPNTLKVILHVLKRATDFVNEKRGEAIRILAPELHLSEEELTEIMS